MNVKNIVSFAKNIEKNNKKFAKLTPAEKRVAVAKDALAQLLLGAAKASPGTYLEPTRDGTPKEKFAGVAKVPSCHVCAIGSVLLSSFRLGEDDACRSGQYGIGVAHYGDDGDGSGGFDSRTLKRMETSFENYGGYGYDEFGDIVDPNARLFAILKNVIDNDGDFKPGPARTDGALAASRAAKKAFLAAKAKAREAYRGV